MAKKRIQEKIVNSRLLFPTILIYGALLMALRWNSQPQMWMQGLSIASTTILMLALNNRYALLRVYSRMVSIAYVVLSVLLLQEPFGLDPHSRVFCSFFLHSFQCLSRPTTGRNHLLCILHDGHRKHLSSADFILRAHPMVHPHRLYSGL